MFDGEHGIVLHGMQGNRASSLGEAEVSWFLSSFGGNQGYILEFGRDGHSKLVFVQLRQDSCLVTKDSSGISTRLGRVIQTLLEVTRETESPFLVGTAILGVLLIFRKSQPSSPFEALNSACFSRAQRDLRPPIKKRLGPRSFSRVSTGESGIPSSCERKDEPAFRPLQGNLAFFQVRASWCPFHLRQQTQGSSHIPIAEGSLHLRCLWKVGIPLQSKPWNQLSSRNDLGCTHLYWSCCVGIGVPTYLCRVSQGISGVA